MRLIRRDPDAAYLDTWLWLPKSRVAEEQISSALRYFDERTKSPITAWRDEPHHFRVPRNFVSSEALGGLPFPVYDTRFKAFPKVTFKSNVVLDAQEPTKTYQRDGSAALLNTHDGILCLRCGAGKTVVSLHSAAQLNHPILVIVQDKGLAKQWAEEIEWVLGIPQHEIGRVGGDGAPFNWERPICIAVINTLAIRARDNTLPVEMTRHFGTIIIDEAHTMGAPFFNLGVPPFHGRRWGLSATPLREDGFDSLLRYTMGQVIYTYLIPDLRPKVFFQRLPTRLNLSDPNVVAATHDISGKLHIGMTYGYLATVPERLDAISKDITNALNAGRQILVLTHSRVMCDELAKRFPSAGICHADVSEADRISRIKNCNPVVAIMRLGKQALNKKSLDTLLVCEPFTKEGTIQQTMGRVLRSMSGKKEPYVVFYDDVFIGDLHGMCNKIRKKLSRWPDYKGGKIPFTNVG